MEENRELEIDKIIDEVSESIERVVREAIIENDKIQFKAIMRSVCRILYSFNQLKSVEDREELLMTLIKGFSDDEEKKEVSE